MGKLTELHLSNFKSWAGTHVLHFGDSFFTSVIGPNGSGKSNTMDAISFVLGIKSSHLRSTHLRDLIYRGRVLKHSKIDLAGPDGANGNEDANGGAEEDEDDDLPQRKDPQSAWVMAVYEDDAGEERRWKRTITASGQSEYRINDRAVSAKQYNDALEAENILIKARNFLVFQGDVEAVASQQPKDLTRLLEQISGSLEYAKEYDVLKAEKDKAEADQSDKVQLRRGINGEIKTYQQQKDELNRFEKRREDKEEAVITHVLWKLHHFQRTIEESSAEMQKHQNQLKEYRRNVQKAEESLDDTRRDQAKVSRKMAKIQFSIRDFEREVEEKEQELLPVNEKLNKSGEKTKHYQQRLSQLTADRQQKQKQHDKFVKDRETVAKAQARWEQEWETQQQQAGRALTGDDLQEYERLRAEVYRQGGNAQVKVDTLTRQYKADEQAVNSVKTSVDNLKHSVETLQSDVDGLKERRTDLSGEVKSVTKDVRAKQVTINELTSERTRSRQKRKELEEKLQQAGAKLLDCQYQQRESAKDTRQRELIAEMKRIFPGVKGMIHQLCKPKQKKYEIALPIVIGRQWDSVVVDSEKTANDCIQYLKEQRKGHTEFLPLDTIVHTPVNGNLRSVHRGARLAIDTIEYDSNVERAIASVCGSDMIVDDWDIARELKWQRKIDVKLVTLEGRCITKADLISGGEGPSDRKRRFEDSDAESLRTLVEKLKSDLDSLPNDHSRQLEEERMHSEFAGLQQKAKFLEEELAALDRNIESKQKEFKFSQSQLKELTKNYEQQNQKLSALKEQLDGNLQQLAQVEDRIFGEFCQRHGYANIREYERQQGTMQQEAQHKKRAFRAQLSQLDNTINYEQEQLKSLQARISKIESDIKSDQALVSALEAQKEEFGNELDQANAKIDQLKEQEEDLRGEADQWSEALSKARKEVEKRKRDVSKIEQAIVTLDCDVEQATGSRYIELRKCRVENIAIPLTPRSRGLDTLPLEEALPEEDDTAMDIDGEDPIRIVKVKDYGIHPDFDDLSDDLKNAEDFGETDAQLAEKIISIQAEIDKMAPNMRSAERLESTSERLRAVDQDYKQAQSSTKRATKAFDDIKKKRMDLFNKAFAHIRDQIDPIYRDLTKSASIPQGGKAYLDVEDEDEPYLSGVKYHATPPGKRFRDMEHLSGGEKTMAALALLFAIHTFAPSPFFVLDEVDAALDVANTTRLANYVKEHAGPGMQFVVISLKTGLFQNSETLVGVMRDQALNSSKALMLDLREYQAV